MVSLGRLQQYLPMPLCSLKWSCSLGLVLRTYARMVGYLKRSLLKERGGKIPKILMKCLSNMRHCLKMGHLSQNLMEWNSLLKMAIFALLWQKLLKQ
nr:hypothetical protein Iba_chr13cCG7290 [Ipomoea batatas]